MRLGKTIAELAQEVMRREENKRDFVVPTDKMGLVVDDKKIKLALPTARGGETFPLTEHTHDQIGTYLDIPSKHYDRLRSQEPDLLANEVNRFLPKMREKNEQPMQRMVRVLDGNARAFLSNRYRRLDYFDMMNAIMPVIAGDSSLQIVSCDVTETRLYLKVLKPSVEAEITKGDPVRAGFVVTNSEIGMGSVSAEPFLERLVCLNGMTVTEFRQRKNHVGRASSSEESFEFYSDDTLRLDDAAFWSKITDTVRATLDDAKTSLIFGKLRTAAENKITGNPEAVVVELTKRFSFSEDQRGGILRNLIDGGVGLNQWGLINAITALANNTPTYDEASALESAGGKLLALPAPEWKSLAAAA